MRLLVVDDEPMIAMDVSDVLVEAGYATPDLASTLEKALARIAAERYDAVVLDANLAGTSAEPVAEALRNKGIPFVVLSGYSSGQLAGRYPDVPLLSKPFVATELIKVVKSLSRKDLP
jgi:DNA-binding response OmpR family regulator